MLVKAFLVLQAVVLVVAVLAFLLLATWLQVKEAESAKNSVGS